ncbi:MAG TPA: NAD(P)-binding domain-containing protein [Candidatus Dormibacteraeota bacterium]
MERTEELDFVILGAGAAGLQLAYFLGRSGHSYVVLEGDAEVGAFWRRYPRSRELISFNRVSSIYEDPEVRMRWDWNSLLTDGNEHLFREYSRRLYPTADEMIRYLRDFATRYSIDIRYGTVVTGVSREGDGFVLRAEDGAAYRGRRLVVATGVRRPHVPDIPGIELAEGYETVPLDPEAFRDQRVLVIGKGNSAFEVVNAMIDTVALVHAASPHPVRMAWRTRHPGNVRANYVRILDTYQLKLLNGVLDCHIQDIRRQDGDLAVRVAYVHADGEEETLHYDRVIRCTGFRFDDGIFDDSCRPDIDPVTGRLPAQTSCWESVNVPDLFFAGTLMQVRDFRRASTPFVDGFRYNIRTLFRMLCQGDPDRMPAGRELPASAAALTAAITARISTSAGLWAQFGYLCDAIVLRGSTATYHEELPRDFLLERAKDRHEHVLTVNFEWGPWDGDVFAIDRHPRHQTAYTNVFLHPVVRHYRCGELHAEHHILEDLLGMYCGDGESGFVSRRSGRDMQRYHVEEHETPLREFLDRQLRAAATTS